MENISLITRELLESKKVLDLFLSDDDNMIKIDEVAQTIISALNSGGKVIACGNGGSHCDAMHFAEELTGRFRGDRRSFPAIAISDPSHITCVGNDYGFEEIFARYVQGIGTEKDVLLGLSTSGNSPNMVRAFEEASARGMKTVALTGRDGGKLAGMTDHEIRVPHQGHSDRIQEVHIKVLHVLILLIEKQLT
ncbi:MAG: D-sedoheptulose 7-phosphate isomerase [Cytophagales bacterium]|nr:D-sedoheptulose 7-phosphate isomerase [Cytophagales bacterium]